MNKRQRKKRQKEQQKVLQTQQQTQQQMQQQTKQHKKYPDDIQIVDLAEHDITPEGIVIIRQGAETKETVEVSQDAAKEKTVEISQDTATKETVEFSRDAAAKEIDETGLDDSTEEKAETDSDVKNAEDKSIIKEILSMFFPAFVLFFFEIVTGISCGNEIFNYHLAYIALFSISYGLLMYFICNLTKKRRIRHIIQAVLLFLLGFMYCILYFLFCEFQLFYDLNTLFAGAGDAVTNFSGDIISMLFTGDGFLHLFLYFLPFLFFIIVGRKWLPISGISVRKKGMVLLLSVFFFISNLIVMQFYPADKDVYGDFYDYNTAIADFGLMTGIRLEVRNMMFTNGEEVAFETMKQVDSSALQTDMGSSDSDTDGKASDIDSDSLSMNSVSDNAMAQGETGEPYGKNQMDIDFEALAQKDGGKYAALDLYVASQEASSKNEFTGLFKGKNLIFITAEAFTEEAIDKKRTPTLYRMAHKGIRFIDYYQPSSAGTTGGEYANIFGMLPTAGGSSMKKTATQYNWSTMASRLSEQGYYGKAYHNNSYTYYDRDKTHVNLGFSDGYEGKGNGLESVLTAQWPESDLEMIQGTFPQYVDKQPFHIYYMTVSGHSLYEKNKNAMARKHWDMVENLNASEPVKTYLAAQIELDAAMEYLIEQLEKEGIAEDTVIVISTDHFPYGLDQNTGALTYLTELYGKPIEDNLYRDHNRLIIWSGCLETMEPIIVNTPTSSMDILPTLCNLFDVEFDSRLLPGRDVFSDAQPLVFTLGYDWKTDKGTYLASKGKFIPNDPNEELPENYVQDMKAIVRDKITYSKGVLQQDYFRHVFLE